MNKALARAILHNWIAGSSKSNVSEACNTLHTPNTVNKTPLNTITGNVNCIL